MNKQQQYHRRRTDSSLSHLEWGGGLNEPWHGISNNVAFLQV